MITTLIPTILDVNLTTIKWWIFGIRTDIKAKRDISAMIPYVDKIGSAFGTIESNFTEFCAEYDAMKKSLAELQSKYDMLLSQMQDNDGLKEHADVQEGEQNPSSSTNQVIFSFEYCSHP